MIDDRRRDHPTTQDPLIAALCADLAKLGLMPDECEQTRLLIRAHDADGFDIDVLKDASEYVVSFGDWHDHFEDAAEVRRLVLTALAGGARVRRVARGSFPYRWSVEELRGGEWTPTQSVLGLFIIPPLWRKKSISYSRNALVRPDRIEQLLTDLADGGA